MVLHRNNGALADRLGNGLQNRVEQFDSARYLQRKRNQIQDLIAFLLFIYPTEVIPTCMQRTRQK